LAVQDVTAHVNSLGCPACRSDYRRALTDFLKTLGDRLCADCIRRRERNPLRVLDCKVPTCREALVDAPSIIDYLCDDCRRDFDTLQDYLGRLKVPYVIDKRLVRGLDYYNRATFEIQTGALGAQSAVAGGGRYDGLVKMLGGPDQPATGFAIGFDRLVEIAGLKASETEASPHLFIAALGRRSQDIAFEWLCALNVDGVRAQMDFSDRSLKSQMKQAGKTGAPYTLILGDQELENGSAVLRDMNTREQFDLPIDGMVERLKKKIRI
jgi:histidyl-tRNA synthetase